MEYEIELKLSTTVQAGELIETHLLSKIAASVKQRELELSNSYFDTTQRDFRKNGMGLRIRGCQHEYEQTIKTAGKSVAGLAQRPEYNVALGKNVLSPPTLPDLSLFPAEIWPANFDLSGVQAQLHCLFETHFKRTVYLLTYNQHSQIELVWDRGSVRANNKQDEINEVELELKQGKVNELFVLARQLAMFMPLKVGLLSKAARGYRLLKTKADKVVFAPMTSLSKSTIEAAQPPALREHLTKHLECWQQLINQFEAEPNGQHFSELKIHWQQLSLLLDRCCKTQQATVELKSDFENFNNAWQTLILRYQHGTSAEQEYLDVVALLTGKTAILLQLTIMQYLAPKKNT